MRFLTAIQVYNEENKVEEVLREVRRTSPEVLVVDDGSTDQTLARLHLDLREDVVDLLDLRGGEVFIAVFEVRARVDHVLVEPQPVELVRDVVVILDGLPVRRLRVVEVASHTRQLACARHGAARERIADVDDVGQLAFFAVRGRHSGQSENGVTGRGWPSTTTSTRSLKNAMRSRMGSASRSGSR